MTTKTFIEKAIEGGWEARSNIYFKGMFEGFPTFRVNLRALEAPREIQIPIQTILLDPEAWKAVGKVEGWGNSHKGWLWYKNEMKMVAYVVYWHRMIDALAEGKTIEQYLETL